MHKILLRSKSIVFRQKAQLSELSRFKNNFLSTTNISYIESLYEQWLKDKSSVSPSLSTYFTLLEQG